MVLRLLSGRGKGPLSLQMRIVSMAFELGRKLHLLGVCPQVDLALVEQVE
jgi:hypothetical protein